MITLLVALAGLCAWAVLATFEVVARDGYRAIPVDRTRLPG